MTHTPAFWLLLGGLPALLLAYLLWRERRERRSLQTWLRDPGAGEIPEGRGEWREVFSLLQRWRKADQRAMGQMDSGLQRFRQAAQALPDGVVLLDADARIEWLNVAAGRHLGLDPERDPGTLAEQLVRQRGFHEYLKVFRAGGPTQPLVFQTGIDASQQTISLLLVAFDRSGILMLSRDVSDLTRVETLRRDFIANVSHELRTPLTVVSGFLEHMLAGDTQLPPELRHFLSLMDDQSRRMNRLVEDLLALSRLESTVEPAREECIDAPLLVRSLLAEANALSAGRHTIELGALAAEGMNGCAEEIHSAFSNLISNAVRYTPPGGTIRMTWTADPQQLVFTVTDTGIGILPEHIPRLTERFYRVDKGRSAATGGTGLGLAIVKHVLMRHQGVLNVRSQPGQGSEFAACFPRARSTPLPP